MKYFLLCNGKYSLLGRIVLCALLRQSQAPAGIICKEKSFLQKLLIMVNQNTNSLRQKWKNMHDRQATKNAIKGNESRLIYEYARSEQMQLWQGSLDEICSKYNLVFSPARSFNSPDTVNFIRENEIDILVNIAGDILRTDILSSAKIGVFNLHMGLLPAFRGVNVLEWSLFCGKPMGMTLHFIDEGIDTGKIIEFHQIQRDKGDTISDLRDKAVLVGIALLKKYLDEGCKFQTYEQHPQDGKQYFLMHPRLKAYAEEYLL